MKFGKIKNQCKICFESVSKRNGLQCQGACKKWAHFKCLNYTPRKICDIKAGFIKIKCPCPDCALEPKEKLTNPQFTYTKPECPATKRPECKIPDCPSKQNPIPECPPQISTSPRTASPPCKNAAKNAPQKITCTPKSLCPSCLSNCLKSNENLANNKVVSPQKSQSCSFDCPASFYSEKPHLPTMCSSDSALLDCQDDKTMYETVEQMCDTVGQLSKQLNDLMAKMINAFQKNKCPNKCNN